MSAKEKRAVGVDCGRNAIGTVQGDELIENLLRYAKDKPPAFIFAGNGEKPGKDIDNFDEGRWHELKLKHLHIIVPRSWD